jgi:cyclopropane fatty-acyl-phospholipid synthase-like methyltransferase
VSTFPPEIFKVSYKGTDPFGDGSRLDHRKYVGADAGSGLEFAEAAKFQLDFLLRQGLRKDDVLLDLGCGCLRGGIHFIRYLAADKYLGMDISAEVVRVESSWNWDSRLSRQSARSL